MAFCSRGDQGLVLDRRARAPITISSSAANEAFSPNPGLHPRLRGDLSSGIPPGIEKDRPLDRLRFHENAAFCPRITSKQVRRLRCIASLHDEKNSTAVRVRAAQDDPALLEEPIHEMGMLLPERLLTAG
jgi:hypothetical protein